MYYYYQKSHATIDYNIKKGKHNYKEIIYISSVIKLV